MSANPSSISATAKVQDLGDQLIIRFDDEASAALPSRCQVAVKATIDGKPYDLVVEPDGHRGHWLKVGDLPNLASGHTVNLVLTPTKDWPEPDIPTDLQAALDADLETKEIWHDITPMARWEWVRWVNSTKNPETRQRRVQVSISKLQNGKRRPCCFDLSSCTDPELSKSGKLIGL